MKGWIKDPVIVSRLRGHGERCKFLEGANTWLYNSRTRSDPEVSN